MTALLKLDHCRDEQLARNLGHGQHSTFYIYDLFENPMWKSEWPWIIELPSTIIISDETIVAAMEHHLNWLTHLLDELYPKDGLVDWSGMLFGLYKVIRKPLLYLDMLLSLDEVMSAETDDIALKDALDAYKLGAGKCIDILVRESSQRDQPCFILEYVARLLLNGMLFRCLTGRGARMQQRDDKTSIVAVSHNRWWSEERDEYLDGLPGYVARRYYFSRGGLREFLQYCQNLRGNGSARGIYRLSIVHAYRFLRLSCAAYHELQRFASALNQGSVEYRGIPIGALVARYIERAAWRLAIAAADLVTVGQAIEEELTKNGGCQAVVVEDINTWVGKALLSTGQIPVFALQHEMLTTTTGLFVPAYLHKKQPVKIYCWGPRASEMLVKLGYSKSSIRMVGHPRIRRIVTFWRRLVNETITILLATQTERNLSMRTLLHSLNVLHQHLDAVFIIRPHPLERASFLHVDLANIDPGIIRIDTINRSLRVFLEQEQVDLVISYSSTVLLEVAAMGIPVLSFCLPNFPNVLALPDCAVVHSIDQLAMAVQRLRNETGFAEYSTRMNNWLSEYLAAPFKWDRVLNDMLEVTNMAATHESTSGTGVNFR